MLTDYLRDQAFAIAWLALMAAGWFGWSQEDPKPRLRPVWGAGSVLGFLLAGAFGVVVWRNWATPTALDGRYWVFGVIVLAEAVLIGGGCLLLARRKQTRWYGWWIGLCVALHFIPLAWIFEDWSYLLLSLVQVAGLIAMLPALRRAEYATSRWACPWVAGTFLLYAAVSAGLFLSEYGYPL
ncbi:hypothetical protein GE115_09070 [Agromyces sp. CFH 90414]|uniref:Uncharacterized protein n=1 Tax=Agromyces agglutinans TaxID=2662258 RepID=A0A6I2FGD7_9MICO|nr:hypothetical protein [Agromyces agglutinans]MRG60018.1 hypothetical protein [Agromyces agglutinans]